MIVRNYITAISKRLLVEAEAGDTESRLRFAFSQKETSELNPIKNAAEKNRGDDEEREGNLPRQKNADLARRNREDGNEAFAATNFHLAVLLYSESLRYSPARTGDSADADETPSGAAAAAANRSAAFYQLGEFEKCLEDVDLALESGYPQGTAYKLHIRKCKCLLQLCRIGEAQRAFDKAVDAIDRSGLKKDLRKGLAVELQEAFINLAKTEEAETGDVTKKSPEKNQDVEWTKLKEPHPKYPSASSAISVKFDPAVGRHVVATRNIEAGEVVFNEAPIVSVLCPEEDATTEACSVCFAYIRDDAPMPCPTCSQTVFCSLTCRRKALDTHHRYECALGPILHASKLDKIPLITLVLRAVTQKPAEYFLDNRDKFSGHNVRNGVDGDDNEVFRSEDYRNLFNLVTHEEKREPQDICSKIAFAVFLTRCLSSAGYFDRVKDRREDAEFSIAAIIVQFLQCFQFNTHMIESVFGNRVIAQDAETRIWKDADKFGMGEFIENARLGGGIYPTLANVNHSCDPNILLLNWGCRTIAFANRPIRAGEQIYDTYGSVYYHTAKDERQQSLKVRSRFYYVKSAHKGEGRKEMKEAKAYYLPSPYLHSHTQNNKV